MKVCKEAKVPIAKRTDSLKSKKEKVENKMNNYLRQLSIMCKKRERERETFI